MSETIFNLLDRDRRQFERLERNFRLRFGSIRDLPAREPKEDGKLIDISGGGVCFSTTEHIFYGAQILIVIDIPGWQVEDGEWFPTTDKSNAGVLKVIGIVKWVTIKDPDTGQKEAGVQFIGQIR